jgi:hypothetical protein
MSQPEKQTSVYGLPGNGEEAGRRPDNVIILTGGLTGSSALAGLLSAAGFWSGEDTFKKRDYNTYENSELIRLNRQLMGRVSASERYTTQFMPEAISGIEQLSGSEDESEYRALVSRCEAHAPWMWKDPRLWMTIRFWKPLLPWERIRVLLLRRDPMQSWISCTQRRQIQTMSYARNYNDSIQASLRDFLEANAIRYLPLQFEDLIVTPEQEVQRIGEFLEVPVTMDHLRSTYSGALYRRPKSYGDALEAFLIYMKNYSERLR